MKANVFRSPSARIDEAKIIDYFIAQHAHDVAIRVADAMEATLESIADFPGLGHPWELTPSSRVQVRWRPVSGFDRFLVFYQETTRGVTVIRVLHASQDIEHSL